MIRDPHSKALLSADAEELQRYRILKKHERRIVELEKNISDLYTIINIMDKTIKELAENK